MGTSNVYDYGYRIQDITDAGIVTGFFTFWSEHGGEKVLGRPMSPVVVREGTLQQLCENGILVYDPDQIGATVKLGYIADSMHDEFEQAQYATDGNSSAIERVQASNSKERANSLYVTTVTDGDIFKLLKSKPWKHLVIRHYVSDGSFDGDEQEKRDIKALNRLLTELPETTRIVLEMTNTALELPGAFTRDTGMFLAQAAGELKKNLDTKREIIFATPPGPNGNKMVQFSYMLFLRGFNEVLWGANFPVVTGNFTLDTIPTDIADVLSLATTLNGINSKGIGISVVSLSKDFDTDIKKIEIFEKLLETAVKRAGFENVPQLYFLNVSTSKVSAGSGLPYLQQFLRIVPDAPIGTVAPYMGYDWRLTGINGMPDGVALGI